MIYSISCIDLLLCYYIQVKSLNICPASVITVMLLLIFVYFLVRSYCVYIHSNIIIIIFVTITIVVVIH